MYSVSVTGVKCVRSRRLFFSHYRRTQPNRKKMECLSVCLAILYATTVAEARHFLYGDAPTLDIYQKIGEVELPIFGKDVGAKPGESLTLVCRALHAGPTNAINWGWEKDDVQFNDEHDLMLLSGNESQPLKQFVPQDVDEYNVATKHIRRVTAADAKKYFCMNPLHNVFKIVEVKVSGPQYTDESAEDFLKKISGKFDYPNLWSAPKHSCDGDDEFTCSVVPLKCISKEKVCDGVKNCDNGKDEDVLACGRRSTDYILCDGPDDMRCDDGMCVKKSLCCNKIIDPSCTFNFCCDGAYKNFDFPSVWKSGSDQMEKPYEESPNRFNWDAQLKNTQEHFPKQSHENPPSFHIPFEETPRKYDGDVYDYHPSSNNLPHLKKNRVGTIVGCLAAVMIGIVCLIVFALVYRSKVNQRNANSPATSAARDESCGFLNPAARTAPPRPSLHQYNPHVPYPTSPPPEPFAPADDLPPSYDEALANARSKPTAPPPE